MKVPAEAAGKRVRYLKCKTIVKVPAAIAEEEKPTPKPGTEAKAASKKARLAESTDDVRDKRRADAGHRPRRDDRAEKPERRKRPRVTVPAIALLALGGVATFGVALALSYFKIRMSDPGTGPVTAVPSVESHEELKKALNDTDWQWAAGLRLKANGYTTQADWDRRGLVTRWEPFDRRTALLIIEKGRAENRYAILQFSEDMNQFTAFPFEGVGRMPAMNRVNSSGAPQPPGGSADAAELKRAVSGTNWDWGEGDVTFKEDGYAEHPVWNGKLGLVTKWEPIDRRTVVLHIEKGRDANRYAILKFSEDLSSFSGYSFENAARLSSKRRAGGIGTTPATMSAAIPSTKTLSVDINSILNFSLAPDGSVVGLSGVDSKSGKDEHVSVYYDLSNGKRVGVPIEVWGPGKIANGGQTVVYGDGSGWYVRDTLTGNQTDVGSDVKEYALSPDGKLLITVAGSKIVFRPLPVDGSETNEVKSESPIVGLSNIYLRGTRIATVHNDDKGVVLRVWDVKTRNSTEEISLGRPKIDGSSTRHRLAIADDGRAMVLTTEKGADEVWDLTGKRKMEWTSKHFATSFRPVTGGRICFAKSEFKIVGTQVTTSMFVAIVDHRTGDIVQRLQLPSGVESFLGSHLGVADDGKRFVSWSDDTNKIYVWDLPGRQPTPPIAAAMDSPTGYENLAGPLLRFADKQFVELTNTAEMIDLNSTFTVEAWVRWDDKNSEPLYLMGDEAWHMMSDEISVDKTAGWVLRTSAADATGRRSLNFTVASAVNKDAWFTAHTRARNVKPGSWHHVAICRSSDNFYLSWNGEVTMVSVGGTKFTNGTTNLFLGPRRHAYKDRLFVGDIRAFQVSTLDKYVKKHDPRRDFEKDGSTNLLLDFTSKPDPMIKDLSAKNRHGELNGPVWKAGD
jgi:hypothetical protein